MSALGKISYPLSRSRAKLIECGAKRHNSMRIEINKTPAGISRETYERIAHERI